MTTVELRAVRESDLPIFYEHQRDPEACRVAGFPSREREAFMAHWQRIMADDTNVLRTILYQGQVAGNIVSFILEGHREVGYWIGREYWGQGIVTQALAEFLRELDERPLYGYVHQHNLGSMRVLEKCGFRRAGSEGEEVIYCLEG